jgi:uroporphyrinogen-III synthase
MRALVSRPREDAERIAAPLRALGVQVLHEPLLVIVPVAGPNIELAGVQGILVTSANGVRALAAAIEERSIPVFAVGDQTARASRELGFKQVESAGGDVASLAELVTRTLKPANGPLLHAAGAVQAGDLARKLGAEGFQVRIAQLYDARPTAALSQATQAALRNGDIDAAFFYSPRTARTFVEHVRKAGLEDAVRHLTAFALSPAVARELDPVLSGRIRVAAHPTQDALLDVFKADLKEALLKQPEKAQQGTPPGKDRSAGPSAATEDTAAAAAATGTATGTEASPATETAAPAGDASSTDKPADKPAGTEGTGPSATGDRSLDDGEGIYAGSTGSRPTRTSREAEVDAQAQADHHTMRSIVRWFVILLVLGAVAYGSMPWWRDRVPEPLQAFLPAYPQVSEPAALSELRTRVEDLSAELADIRDSVGAAASTADQALAAAGAPPEGVADAAALEALRGRLNSLEQSLTEQATSGTGPAEATTAAISLATERLNALEAGLSAVQEQTAALGDRLDAVESQVSGALTDLSDGQAEAVGLLLSVGMLRERVSTSKPYDAALAAVSASGPGDAVAEEMATLAEHADTGVKTLPELRRAFGDVVDLAARRTLIPEGDSWWTDTVSSLMESVTIRRKGEVIAGGGLAALSSAEVLLAEDDLTGAIEALSKLDGDAAAVVADWMADARARASVDAALASLNAAVLARVGEGPTTE